MGYTSGKAAGAIHSGHKISKNHDTHSTFRNKNHGSQDRRISYRLFGPD